MPVQGSKVNFGNYNIIVWILDLHSALVFGNEEKLKHKLCLNYNYNTET